MPTRAHQTYDSGNNSLQVHTSTVNSVTAANNKLQSILQQLKCLISAEANKHNKGKYKENKQKLEESKSFTA